MITYFESLNPVVQALLGTLFTWFMTALGAGAVFPKGDEPQDARRHAGVRLRGDDRALPVAQRRHRAGGGPVTAGLVSRRGRLLLAGLLRLADACCRTCTPAGRLQRRRVPTRRRAPDPGDHAAQLPGGWPSAALARPAGMSGATVAGRLRWRWGLAFRTPEGMAVSRHCGEGPAPEELLRQISGMVEPVAIVGATAVIVAQPICTRAGLRGRDHPSLPSYPGGWAQRESPHRHHRRHAWLCRDDSPGCRAGVRSRAGIDTADEGGRRG